MNHPPRERFHKINHGNPVPLSSGSEIATRIIFVGSPRYHSCPNESVNQGTAIFQIARPSEGISGNSEWNMALRQNCRSLGYAETRRRTSIPPARTSIPLARTPHPHPRIAIRSKLLLNRFTFPATRCTKAPIRFTIPTIRFTKPAIRFNKHEFRFMFHETRLRIFGPRFDPEGAI